MKSKPSLSELIERTSALRQAANKNEGFHSVSCQLKAFQNSRLRNTYQDLLADSAFVSGAEFFLDHLYGSSDLSKRDGQAARVIPKAQKLLPQAGVDVLSEVLEMDYLAELMDGKLTQSIIELSGDSNVLLEDGLYLEAFRKVGELETRKRQIGLVGTAGHRLAKLMRLPMLSGVLRMTHGAAQKANLEDFHKFLALGVQSFKSVKDPRAFFSIIQTRESELLRRIFDEGITSFK